VDIAVLLNGASELSRRYNEPVAEYLRDLGLRRILLSERFIHAKLIVVDDYVILGFHNLTSSSVASRLELSMTIESKSLANALDTLFEHFYSEEERGWMVAAMELWGEIQEPMVLCKFVGIPPAHVVGLYSYATGIRRTTPDLMKIARRIFTLKRLFNVACGIWRTHDTLPRRFLSEPLKEGGSMGQVVDLKPMLKEYYEYMGRDKSGVPRREIIEELGLAKYASKLGIIVK